jgi:hypothetical protein
MTEKNRIDSPPLPIERQKEPISERSPGVLIWPRSRVGRLDFSETPQFAGGPQRRSGFKLSAWTLASAVVDFCVNVGLTALFLFVGLVTLQMTAKGFLTVSQLAFGGGILFSVISIGYFLLLRLYLGATFGELSCGLRLGQVLDRQNKYYVAKIIWRLAIIAGTGVVVLPLLSLIFRQDLAGRLSGLSVYSLK